MASFIATFRVHYYDKDLFEAIAHNISANFTKFETDQLLKVRIEMLLSPCAR